MLIRFFSTVVVTCDVSHSGFWPGVLIHEFTMIEVVRKTLTNPKTQRMTLLCAKKHTNKNHQKKAQQTNFLRYDVSFSL